LDPRQLAHSTITIQWKNGIPYPREVNFKIKINPDEIEPQDGEGNTLREFDCLFRNTRELKCEFSRDGVITVRDALTSRIERA
jgi:hypothetical protein